MNIAIHQIYYKLEQKQRLDPSFAPYNNIAHGDSDWCEWRVMNEAFQAGVCAQADLVGFVSWKFRDKTGISGEIVLKYIHDHPGFDVYFANPYQDAMVTWGFRHVWEEADQWHHGIKDLAMDVLKRTNHAIEWETLVTRREETCYCNYWIANSRFWEAFMAFAVPAADILDHGLSEEQQAFLEHSKMTTKQGVTFRPFIMERLFSTFLAMERGRFQSVRIPLPSPNDAVRQDILRYIHLGNAWKDDLAQRPDRVMASALDHFFETLRSDYLARRAAQQQSEKLTPKRQMMGETLKRLIFSKGR